MTGAVRGDGKAQPPPAVAAETAQQPRQHQPLEAERRDRADIARQPPLAGPEPRRPDEQHQMPPDHP
jgi:hypothetical protein